LSSEAGGGNDDENNNAGGGNHDNADNDNTNQEQQKTTTNRADGFSVPVSMFMLKQFCSMLVDNFNFLFVNLEGRMSSNPTFACLDKNIALFVLFLSIFTRKGSTIVHKQSYCSMVCFAF
jgi:hypothetical protein